MSEAEIHTLETFNSDHSVGSDTNDNNTVDKSPPSPSCIIVSDDDETPHLDNPKMIITKQAATAVNKEDVFANTDLETACQDGDLHLVDQLLTNENINSGGLHHAAAYNQWRVCRLIIARGADVNHKLSPLNATPILWAARHGHAYIVKLLLDHGADPTVIDNSGFSLLHLAIHSSNVMMVAYAVHLELDVNRPDIGNRTPLHWAIVQGDHLSVEVLLKAGASPNVKDGEGAVPLHLATFNSQSELIVSLLLQHGADPMGIAIDLTNPPRPWIMGCRMSGRQVTGFIPKSRLISPELAKIITSITPIVIIPLSLSLPYLLGSTLLGIPLGIILAWQAKRGLGKYVIPLCWLGEKAVLQSTLIAGIFVSIFTCIVTFWFRYMAVIFIVEQPLSSLIVIALILLIISSYTAAMLLDPGIVEPKSMVLRLKSMNELMDRGLFDSVHLCIHTFVPIPERAQYDYYLERVVCRYDHYCPWMYNAIGVRNHRAFVVFLSSLAIAIPLAGVQYMIYVGKMGHSSFGNCLCVLTLAQAIWIYILAFVQIIQIVKGVTSYEISHMEQLTLYRTDPIKAYSSLPKDHPKAFDVLGDVSSAASLLKHSHASDSHNCRDKKHKHPLWMRLTGISQIGAAMKLVRSRTKTSKTDYGAIQNLKDFWYSGGNFLRPNGTISSLGGVAVDYSTLYELPSKQSTEIDQMLV